MSGGEATSKSWDVTRIEETVGSRKAFERKDGKNKWIPPSGMEKEKKRERRRRRKEWDRRELERREREGTRRRGKNIFIDRYIMHRYIETNKDNTNCFTFIPMVCLHN